MGLTSSVHSQRPLGELQKVTSDHGASRDGSGQQVEEQRQKHQLENHLRTIVQTGLVTSALVTFQAHT